MLSPNEILQQFVAHYQPIVDIITGEVVGFEALSRKIEPDGSTHPAGPLIEEIEQDLEALTALIRATFHSVGRDLSPLFDKYPGFYISINIPPAILGSGRVADMFQELNLVPYLNRIVCEVTERQALTDLGRSALRMAREFGIRVAVDDFGTGNSGLAQIAGLELDILKIDRSLIVPVLRDRFSAKLLRGIVALAMALHMRTVAEGVETWEQAFFMQAAGVDYGQGWFWSKAVPADQVEQAIKNGFHRPAHS